MVPASLLPVDPLLTRQEAADLLKLKCSTLEVWAVKGRGPSFLKIGARAVRYRLSEVQRWVDSCGAVSGSRR
jgi:predicted DNA-binding transcriptional regulator AlpA